MRARFTVDIDHFATGADSRRPGALPLGGIECGHIQHYSAQRRHRLPVVTSATAARGDRHLVPDAGSGDPDYVCLVARTDHGIGGASVELAVQH
jgi:hypothetical protein